MNKESEDHYEITEQIKYTMYGPVYKANDTTSNDYVTIHIVETIAPDKMKEIEVLNSIRSKFIIQYIDFDTHYDRVRFVTEYSHCGSLFDYIMKGNALNKDELREITACSLMGLYYLHSRSIIHGNIQPDNMFISESGVIKLGSVMPPITAYRSSSKRSTRNETMVHLAPEAFEGRLSLKSDIWALGISLIELADGRNPFYGFSGIQIMKQILFDSPPSLSEKKWPSDFVDFVNQCLMKEVDNRPSVKQLIDHPFVKNSINVLRRDGFFIRIQDIARQISVMSRK